MPSSVTCTRCTVYPVLGTSWSTFLNVLNRFWFFHVFNVFWRFLNFSPAFFHIYARHNVAWRRRGICVTLLYTGIDRYSPVHPLQLTYTASLGLQYRTMEHRYCSCEYELLRHGHTRCRHPLRQWRIPPLSLSSPLFPFPVLLNPAIGSLGSHVCSLRLWTPVPAKPFLCILSQKALLVVTVCQYFQKSTRFAVADLHWFLPH